jgi:hypothetical protein
MASRAVPAFSLPQEACPAAELPPAELGCSRAALALLLLLLLPPAPAPPAAALYCFTHLRRAAMSAAPSSLSSSGDQMPWMGCSGLLLSLKRYSPFFTCSSRLADTSCCRYLWLVLLTIHRRWVGALLRSTRKAGPSMPFLTCRGQGEGSGKGGGGQQPGAQARERGRSW